ncbi:MAG: spermidine synthase, partial [Acidobacteria bacterium]|nr:spermidine synthase [Acidobacteriota bacterium]
MPALRVAAASFLVLFLEIALIRWLPAHIRLLSFFSNFILLASFLGIGLGCLLAPTRSRLFAWFPLVLAAIIGGVWAFRIEVAVQASGAIYFTSGTTDDVVAIESIYLLPLIFMVVVGLFAALAERMGREMATMPAIQGYLWNVCGSLLGVIALGLLSWSQWPPQVWFGIGLVVALPFILTPDPNRAPRGAVLRWTGVGAMTAAVVMTAIMAAGTIWSPYYKVLVRQDGADTVVEVNNIFHQSMAPLEHKEYFYQWPYEVFGDTFEDVLILGAGSGTDVTAALRHGAKSVDAVEIDPVILSLGKQLHPAKPFSDPRLTIINDDGRHFLRTTEKKYDLIVYALIDSLTLQSGFSGVRLESYMFTEEAFANVRDRLKPNGLMVMYNYFREDWLVDRLANTAAKAFNQEPWLHVHAARAYLGVMLAGPRLADMP